MHSLPWSAVLWIFISAWADFKRAFLLWINVSLIWLPTGWDGNARKIICLVRRLKISLKPLHSKCVLCCRMPSHFLLPAAGATFSVSSWMQDKLQPVRKIRRWPLSPRSFFSLYIEVLLVQVCQPECGKTRENKRQSFHLSTKGPSLTDSFLCVRSRHHGHKWVCLGT